MPAKLRHYLTIILIGWDGTALSSWSDEPPAANPSLYSEPFCLKIFAETAERSRSSTWQISDRDRHILTQCRAKYPATIDPTVPLPQAAQCVDLVKTLVREGVEKVRQIELPAEQVKSLARCDEVVTYHRIATKTMLPTLQPNERVVIDKTSYQDRSPQRGEIVAVKLTSTSTDRPELSIERIIGLPGEKFELPPDGYILTICA